MPKPQPKPTYQQLQSELDEVLAALQSEELDVDEAIKHYERGLQLAKQLEAYLKTAENKVRDLTKKHIPKA
jgi:exodeoxyribonuclease VII small subunit